MIGTSNLLKYSAYIIMFSLITPWIYIGSYGVKIDYIVILLSLPVLFLTLKDKFVEVPFIRVLVSVCLLLFFLSLISNSLGYVSFKNQYLIYFPTEWTQVLNRVFCAVLFYYIGYYNILEEKRFFKTISIVFMISLIFGALQIMRIPGLDSFFSLYATSDNQLQSLNNAVNRRIFGSVGNSIAWGGLCIFMFYYFYLLASKNLTRILGIILALIGVLFSGSKSAIISLVVSLLFCTFYKSLKGEHRLFKLLLGVLYLVIFVFAINFVLSEYFPAQYEFLFFRFSKFDESLAADSYDGRGYQLTLLYNLIKTDPMNLIFGVGKPMLYELVGFVEIEFFYLLGCYGILGASLHYYLLFYLSKTSIQDKLQHNHKTFILVTTLAYLVFSLGFYFFRELGAGLYYWIFVGYLIGINHKKNKIRK